MGFSKPLWLFFNSKVRANNRSLRTGKGSAPEITMQTQDRVVGSDEADYTETDLKNARKTGRSIC
jgi:hypothetical protein